MKLLVGLGNPDPKYANTRHNVGYVAIDYFQKNIEEPDVIFKKSDEFMNNSGKAVQKFLNFYKLSPDDLFVVHDDLDLALGDYKIQFGKGPQLHGGINSTVDFLETDQFWRVRIGVDNRDLENRISGEAYVLQDFGKEELETVNKVLEKIKAELEEVI